ncbi:MAG: response regulator [Saprospiraceae bacterium]
MRKNILVIDDCPMMRQFLLKYLSKEYRVTALEDAYEAFTLLKDGYQPDLIIVDYNLPEMSGLGFLNHLRIMRTDLDHIPVLMLSGEKSSTIRWRCLEAGAADFLIKPFFPKELEVRVRNLIQPKFQKNNSTTISQ